MAKVATLGGRRNVTVASCTDLDPDPFSPRWTVRRGWGWGCVGPDCLCEMNTFMRKKHREAGHRPYPYNPPKFPPRLYALSNMSTESKHPAKAIGWFD